MITEHTIISPEGTVSYDEIKTDMQFLAQEVAQKAAVETEFGINALLVFFYELSQLSGRVEFEGRTTRFLCYVSTNEEPDYDSLLG